MEENTADTSVTKANLVYSEHNSEFVKSIAGFYIGTKFRDITFVCKRNVRVHAHKAVIASFSKFLSEVISSNNQDIVYVSLPDIEQNELRLLLMVLYRGSVRLKNEELEILKDICTYLDIDIRNLNIEEVGVTENCQDNPEDGLWDTSVRKSVRRKRPSKRKREEDYNNEALSDYAYNNEGLSDYVYNNEALSDNASMDCSFAIKPEPKKISSYLKGRKIEESPLSEVQLEVLENAAQEHIIPNEQIRMQLAEELGMTFFHVSRWFITKLNRNKAGTGKRRSFKEFCLYDPRRELLEDIYKNLSNKYLDKDTLKKMSRDLSLSIDVIRQWFIKKREEEKESESKNLLNEHEATLEAVLSEHKFPDAQTREDLAHKTGVPLKQITKWFVMKITGGHSDISHVRVNDPRNEMLEEIYKTNEQPNVKQVSLDLAMNPSYVTNWFLRRQEKENKQMIAIIEAAERQKKDKFLQKCQSNKNNAIKFFTPEHKNYSRHPSFASCSSVTNKSNAGTFMNIQTDVKKELVIEEEAMSEDESAEGSVEPDLYVTDMFETRYGKQDLKRIMDNSDVEVEINPLMFCEVDVKPDSDTEDEPH